MPDALRKAKRGLLCLSLAERDTEALIQRAEPVIGLADLVELRLDTLIRPEYAATVSAFRVRFPEIPILATNRPSWEGGSFLGPESTRLAGLEAALAAGASFIDIETRTEPAPRDVLIQKVRDAGARPLVSWHDFAATPAALELANITATMRATGAQSGKLVTTAHSPADAARILGLLKESRPEFPLSAFAMGTSGAVTRFASLYLGGHISYAAADAATATAPGQLALSQLRSLCDSFHSFASLAN